MITKLEIQEYINEKPYLHSFPYGQFWKVKIGERSTMEGKFTSKHLSDKALQAHVGDAIECNRKLQKKREAKLDAKKTKS